MKRRTLNAIMLGVIIVLVIGIVVCIPLIFGRRKLTPLTSEEPSSIPVEEGITFYEEPSEEVSKDDQLAYVKITDDNINVRSGPGTDYDRLGSAYYGNTFKYISQSHDGWTKIVYDGKDAYVYSKYVELVAMVENVDGEIVEYLGADAKTQEEMIEWSDAAPEDGGEGEEGNNTEGN